MAQWTDHPSFFRRFVVRNPNQHQLQAGIVHYEFIAPSARTKKSRAVVTDVLTNTDRKNVMSHGGSRSYTWNV